MTVGELRTYLRQHIDKGCTCVCSQHVQRYSRPITSAMAAGLMLLLCHEKKMCDKNENPIVWDTELSWTHVEDFFKNTPNLPSSIRGDFSKLRFWNLIESHPTLDGYYRTTFQGCAFVKYKLKLKSNVLIYNNKSYGFKGPDVGIRDCLKNKFNYELLMKGEL